MQQVAQRSRSTFSARHGAAKGRRALVVRNAVKEVFMPALSSTMTEGKCQLRCSL